MRKSWKKCGDCKIIGYKFRSSPTVTFGPTHYIQEPNNLFFGPFYGTYQRYVIVQHVKHPFQLLSISFRARVAWKAKKRRKAKN